MKTFEGLIIDDRFRLVSLIAVGGMGQVWRGWDATLDREVAVKILREEFTGDHGYLERFRAEARHTAALTHENIAALFDYGEESGTAYLVMELVPGVPLADLVEKSPMGMPVEQCITVLIQVAEALQVAHQEGVVHRDVKPENILVDTDNSVKITDFGIARSTNEAKITKTGLVMGTAQYLSPEQAMGKPATALSDIYSLGIVAFEMLSGGRPFVGESQVDIAMAQVKEPVPPLPPRVPPLLRDLVLKILSKAPMDRPRSAASVVRALQAIQRGERPPITAETPVVTQAIDPAATQLIASQAAETAVIDRAPEAPPVSGASTARVQGSAQPLAPAVAAASPNEQPPPSIQTQRPATAAMPAVDVDGRPLGTITGQRKRGLGLPSIALIGLVLLALLGGVLVWMDRSQSTTPKPTPAPTTVSSPATTGAPPETSSPSPSTASSSATPTESGSTSATASTPPTTASTASSVTPGAATVLVDPQQYLGGDATSARDELFALGLNVKTQAVGALQGRPAGTVVRLSPTGQVPVGETVTLEYTSVSGIPAQTQSAPPTSSAPVPVTTQPAPPKTTAPTTSTPTTTAPAPTTTAPTTSTPSPTTSTPAPSTEGSAQ